MRLESLMQNLNSIDPVHVRAMKDWGLILPEEQPELGSSLEKLISRLPELDQKSLPIAPEFD
jgi:hypothetical protein